MYHSQTCSRLGGSKIASLSSIWICYSQCRYISSTILYSFKIYRLLAVNIPVLELQSGLQDKNSICIKPDDKELWNESESGIVEEEDIQSCGRLIQLIDAQYNDEVDPQTKTIFPERDAYMEQERAVLETFRDCLHKYMKVGFKKGTNYYHF